ncbi:hypothetical protein P43SY_005304 [Pythium insidiosum]|uniref:BZIP domain-containing protein n=1 Tax=Pythium insidiosum TaxID=114742 RepID=A0AAD5Q4W9_PYTIN|nr:hypothetical protein P43SY_005304 [Pythium insidiosum]
MRRLAEVLLSALVLLTLHPLIFRLYAHKCELATRSGGVAESTLRAVVISDIHLLGKRRRSWIERVWIDWQSYVDRFFSALRPAEEIATMFVLGNHDVALGRYQTVASIRRFEMAFGPSNRMAVIKRHRLVQLNTMALDSDVTLADVRAEAERHVATLNKPHVFVLYGAALVLLAARWVSGGSAAEDEFYPFLADESDGNVPLSPDDQALLMGMYPGANLTDFEFAMMGPNGMQQQHHAPMSTPPTSQQRQPQPISSPGQLVQPSMTISIDPMGSNERLKMPGLSQTTAYFDPHTVYHQGPPVPMSHQQMVFGAPRRQGGSPSTAYSPSSNNESDSGLRDSEEILNAPVKSLTDEEKKLRRRAQVAKSARKHRNRQKEELARLREQVQFLQEQMEAMRSRSGSVEMEKDAITMHRKRKKLDDVDVSFESALADQTGFASAAQRILDNAMVSSTTIQHGFHHLPVDTLQRTSLLQQIATKRAQYARQYLHNEFGSRDVQYPHMDIKLNSNGPDMEIKLVRAKAVPGFSHLEVADAAWNSVFNFDLEIPERFRRYVKCERLMELDDRTRYGRTIGPLLKNREENFIVYMHSYFVVHRLVCDDCVIITWESIAMDDLYPFESSDTALRNDEVGCMIMETEVMPNGENRTLVRTIIHSTPPVAAITEPRGRVNEAFLTVFCRNADILETSARLHLRKKYPDRAVKTEFEVIKE